MAEEEVNYASVVFKAKQKTQPQAEQEEPVYSEVKVRNKTSKQSAKTNVEQEEEPVFGKVQVNTSKLSSNTNAEEEEPVYGNVNRPSQTSEQSADTNASLIPDKNEKSRCPPCPLVATSLAIVCVILIAGITVVCIFFLQQNQKTELGKLKDNQTALLNEIHNLTEHNNRLSSEYENLRQNYSSLTIMFKNVTEAYAVSELIVLNLTEEKQGLTVKIQNLTTESQGLTVKIKNLTIENQGLKTENKELKTQSNNLTQQIQDEKTEWIQSNVTRAQWSINAYCRIDNQRQCQSCQKGWTVTPEKSSCYAFNNPEPPGQKTWTEAQENCRGKGSDLAVIANETEKKFVSDYKHGNRFWIGLRVVEGKWKWVDGSDTTDSLWTEPANKDHCVVSDKADGWKSVSCSERNQWVCELAALSV